MYVPFMDSCEIGKTEDIQSRTMAFGAIIDCNKEDKVDYSAYILPSGLSRLANFSLTMTDDANGNRVTCHSGYESIKKGPIRLIGYSAPCQTGILAMEVVLLLAAAGNAT